MPLAGLSVRASVGDADKFYPKQPLDRAVQIGLSRPQDSPERQKVRMGDDPLRSRAEQYSIRTAKESGREYQRGPTIGEAADEDRAASTRPSRRHRRGHRR